MLIFTVVPFEEYPVHVLFYTSIIFEGMSLKCSSHLGTRTLRSNRQKIRGAWEVIDTLIRYKIITRSAFSADPKIRDTTTGKMDIRLFYT